MKYPAHDAAALCVMWCGMSAVAADSGSGPAPSTSTNNTVLETIVVTGSHIPRSQVEGPAPVFTISQQDISRSGYTSVADLMGGLTQNVGALDNNQNTDGFSPGAQAVDLRGLGPNHTLVLVNGRRIADYPQSYGGNSNFTDISSIPISMIDHVEVLSGSASAIYGSDAISGVINFILKKTADGTTVDLRAGTTQKGGGTSERLSIVSGFNRDRFEGLFAVELYNQQPVWAYDRPLTASRLSSPGDPSTLYPSLDFVRTDVNENYLDPGQATCNKLSYLDGGSVAYASRPGYGNYCGSYTDVGYGTLQNSRKQVSVYGTGSYHLTNNLDLFLDLQATTSNQASYNTPLEWQNSYKLNGDSTPIPFYNQATGQVEQWQRQYFSINENGGLDAGEIHNIGKTLSINTGLKGSIPGTSWQYEVLYGHAQSVLEQKWPALVSSRAQAFYLGPSLGIDPASGYNIYNAPISRLYTPLTVAQFRSITQLSIDNDKSRSDSLTLTANDAKLFNLPAGPVGFAAVAEYGNQYFGLTPDPLSLDGTYYGLHNTTAVGSRDHFGVGIEASVPILSQVTGTAAGRYDQYKFASNRTGKVTYQAGLEYRPVRTLLVRGSAGTGFRAPDLSYVFAGLSGSSSSGTDYYQCRKYEASKGPDFYDNCTLGDVSFNGRSIGSTALKDETSTSLTYGLIWSPAKTLEIAADYYAIKLSNEVLYQSSDQILRAEADCRLGVTIGGTPVNSASSQCAQIESQVVRNSPTAPYNPFGITSVLSLPINATTERTTGIDVNVRWQLATERFGSFDFNAAYTEVLTHTIQLYADNPVDDELKDWYNYVIPRNKASYSATWSIAQWAATLHGARTGGLPNYQGTARLAATTVYNATISFRLNNRASASLIADNVFDKQPQRDSTWTSYPYYATSWFNALGRQFFVQASYRFGGRD